MIAKIINLGITDNLKAEEAMIVRLTNIVGSIPILAYLFYLCYWIYYKQVFSIALASSLLIITVIALILNSRGRYGLAKTMLFTLNSISIWLIYHVFNVDYSILTSYFPIIFCFPLFFNIRKEREYFYISALIVLACITSSFFIQRQVLYAVNLSEEIVSTSNLFHIIVSFVLTVLIALAIYRNQHNTYGKLIIEREKLTDALNNLQSTQAQLVHSEKMASVGLLMAGVSHEINNPLNFVKGSVSGLKMELKNNNFMSGSTQKYMEIMDEGVDRIDKIVKSLNHFNNQTPNFNQDCDLETILGNCLNILNHELRNGIQIKRQFSGDTKLKANSGQLHQVFLNLIANAVHAMPGHGMISLRTETKGDFLHTIVEDTGKGIAPERQYKIFEPFYTTKDPGKGTGLGLSIAYKIIKDHGGDITIASDVGQGTSIRIRLPKDHAKLKRG